MKKISIITTALLLLSFSAHGALYRWIDEKGNVFYSDKIPPKAAKHGHIELDQNGLHKKYELSLAKLKELEAIKKQRELLLAEKKQKAKKATLKKMQDEQLLAIYSTREELINVFNNKIKMAATTIKILKIRHKKLAERLAKTEAKYEKMKNPAFKQTITKKIENMLDGLKVYQQAITENIIEQNKLNQRFKMDLKRYDSLVLKNKPVVDNIDLSKTSKEPRKEMIESEKKLSKERKISG